MTNEKVYQIVTEKIIKLIEEKGDDLSWQRDWSQYNILPQNYESKSPYHGSNRLVCGMLFDSPYFLTYKQAKKMGGNVRKGANGIPITYWNVVYYNDEGEKVKKKEDATKAIPFLRYFTVFNSEDIEGIEFEFPEVETYSDTEKIEKCEKVVASHKDLRLVGSTDKAYYTPMNDTVHMPDIERFKTSEGYYNVLFHEMSHWTGHKSRLDRGVEKPSPFGTPEYSKEELVAEMSTAMVCQSLQISSDDTIKNNAAYLKSWLGALKADPSMLIVAGGKAQKAADYILKTKTEEA